MGRPLFTGFVTDGNDDDSGVRRDGEYASWRTLLAAGRGRAAAVAPGRAYLVDPGAGLETFVSFFAVATVADTALVWADPTTFGHAGPPLGPALYEVDWPADVPLRRPLWGIMTSGTSGTPKLPMGYADSLELVALHYQAAVFGPVAGDVTTFLTCLPLQFSGAFFMTVLPALFLRRDLRIFQPHDWRPVAEAAAAGPVVCMSVPAITAAGSMSLAEPADLSRALVLMGAGYVTAPRVRTIRERFVDVRLGNIYGTAETGAIAIDWAPGTARHVGRPIPGKPVWLVDPDEQGVGTIATTGPDCRRYLWTPGEAVTAVGDTVASTDYGHFDAEGNLFLDGRLDGGEKLHGVTVYPRAIERHILDLAGIVDVRVTIDRPEHGADRLLARVVGAVSDADVRDWCASLPEVQRPAQVTVIPERDALSAYSRNGKL